jgi:GNAT superfamily N-acetyltransferase
MEIVEASVRDTFEDMDVLLHDYWQRSEASEDVPPLNMNWRAYMQLNDQFALKLFTARTHMLVGFVMYHVHEHLHHIGTTNAACDILAVHIDARGKGVARKMMEFAEPKLREVGVTHVTHQFRTCYNNTKPLFPKLGYKLIEYGYLKDLI